MLTVRTELKINYVLASLPLGKNTFLLYPQGLALYIIALSSVSCISLVLDIMWSLKDPQGS